MRVTRWILFLSIALGLAGRATAEEPFVEETDRLADRVLQAFLDTGADGAAALATKQQLLAVDPFRVAERLLLRHARALVADPPTPDKALDAAAAWAKEAATRPAAKALPKLVERWRDLRREDLERLLRLRTHYVAQQRAWQARDYTAVGKVAEQAAKDTGAATWSTTAIDVDALGSAALALTGRGLDAGERDQALSARCLSLGWVRSAAALLRRAAGVYQRAGNLELATQLLSEARKSYEALDREADVALTLVAEARVDQQLERLDRATEKLAQARDILERLGDKAKLGQVYTSLGNVARGQGRLDDALAAHKRTLQLGRELEDDESVVIALTNLGTIYWDLEDHEASVEHYEQALAHAGATGAMPSHRLDVLRLNLAGNLALHGGHARAVELCREVITNQRATQTRQYLPVALATLGLALKRVGAFAEALDALEEALALFRERGQVRKVFDTLRNLASVLAPAGRLDEALRYGREALELAQRVKHAGAIAQASMDLASIHLHREESQQAFEILEAAEPLVTASGSPAVRQQWVLLTASALSNLGQREKALPLFREALEVARKRKHVAQEIAALKNIAITQEALGRLDEAAAGFEEAQEVAERVWMRPLIAEILWMRCKNEFQLGNYAKAAGFARRAVELQLELARGLGAGEAVAVRGRTRMAADFGLDALLALIEKDGATTRRLADAFWFAEAGRGLGLLEQVENRETLGSGDVPDALRHAESKARSEVRTVQGRLLEAAQAPDPGTEALAALRDKLDQAYVRLDAAIASVERARRRQSRVIDPRPAALDAVMNALPKGAALLNYQLMPGGQAVVFFVKQGQVHLFRLGNTESVVELARNWRRLLQTPGTDDRAAARALYERILAPVAEEVNLSDFERLVVAPDGVLALVPLDALVHGEGAGKRLIERHEVVCVPSASVFAALPKASAGRGLLALGDPVYPGEVKSEVPHALALRGLGDLGRLPATGDEVRAIGALFEGAKHVLLRENASREALQQALSGARNRLAALHIACHGVLDTERPMLTGLALSGGDVLSVADVYRLNVPADLVVLSACETGLGQLTDSEGVLGLARAFFFAGAPRVVVSGWKVSDQQTKELMVAFYTSMRASGHSPSAALRKAKLERIAAGHAHPYHWAGFTLWGAP